MSTKKKKQSKEKASDYMKEKIEENAFRQIRLNIKHFNLTDKQKTLVEMALKKDTKIIFINGVAGSSKTFLSVYCALHMLNINSKYEIKYIRTIAESGERALGALPGTVDEKFNPFMMPLYDKLDELIPITQSKYLEEQGFIEALPVNFLRGTTWNDKIVIADESQNYSAKELITLLTRIGENTKLFICGDAMQSDIGSKSGFMKIYDIFNNAESEEKGIYCFHFEEADIMRSEILKFIVHTLKKLDKVNNV
jgi:phosphate starvation-inducible PhoH-like protein